MNRLFFFLILFVFLGGCAQIEERVETDQTKSARWLEHQLSINAIHTWNINGRLSVKTAKDSGTATLNWKQNNNEYEFRLIAPLGQGTYTLKGYAEGVILQRPDNKILTADTPEELMLQGFGWSVHLEGFKYWVRGLPQPDVSYTKLELDNKGRLTDMQQSGFEVSVKRYVEFENYSLPEKLFIKGDNIELKMIIQNWET